MSVENSNKDSIYKLRCIQDNYIEEVKDLKSKIKIYNRKIKEIDEHIKRIKDGLE